MGASAVAVRRRGGSMRELLLNYEDTGYFVLLAILGVWGAQGLSALALNNVSAVVFGAAQVTRPVVTFLGSLALGYERFRVGESTTWGKLGGVALAVGSAIMLVVLSASNRSAGRTEDSNVTFGFLILLLQIALGGSYAVAQKRILYKYSPLFTAAWAYVIGCGLLLMSVVTGATSAADWDFSPTAAGAAVYSGVLASGLNYALLAYCNKLTGPLTVAASFPLQALTSAILSYFILGSELTWAHLYGGVGTTVGLLLLIACQTLEVRWYGPPPAIVAAGGGPSSKLNGRRSPPDTPGAAAIDDDADATIPFAAVSPDRAALLTSEHR